ncbi:DUF4333 domain-containing protein [Saccharomonospora saliphila]|uniref:DUF4333 domain-containing protein n=1 Tax=Saccharomonospora saliphila TaxID=369829 RepID=UPI000367AD53|nr:DUF4333 domain-containing protein [Saccharomonospora saliphila]
MRRGIGLGVTVLLAALAATACGGADGDDGGHGGSGDGPPRMSRGNLERSAIADLERSVGQRPDEVTCDGDLEGTVGATQRCRLAVGSDRLGFTVTVTGVDGRDIRYEIQIDQTPS